MIDVIWDMETGDPDDFLTLLLLLGHPQVNLKAVTITPGTTAQVGLVRYAVNKLFSLDIPIGAYNINYNRSCVSQWHYKVYGDIPPSSDAEPGARLLLRCCDANTTLITGGPPKNLGAVIKLAAHTGNDFRLGCWVAQGGFAGDGVVPLELQIKKFCGLTSCPSYNLNGAPKATLAALDYMGIGIRRFVSKNVCHRVYYDSKMHKRFNAVKDKNLSLRYIWKGMDAYLKKNPSGKKFHDPLAACCAIDESIATWAEVKLSREGDKWGAKLAPGSNTWIIVDYDEKKFIEILTAY